MQRCSFIIMHKEASSQRTNNLIALIKYLSRIMVGSEIIVVEQDEKPRAEKSLAKLPIRYFFLYNSGLYNKAWSLNFGAKKANGVMLVFNDGDLYCSPDTYIQCVTGIGHYDVLKPYNKCHNLTQQETAQFQLDLTWNNAKGPSREGPSSYVNISGGILFIRKVSFERIGGWDERFEGHSGEDDHMNHKILQCLRKHIFMFPANHLWHELTPRTNFHKNEKILNDLRQQGKDVILEEAKRLHPLNGNPDKYVKALDYQI